MNVNGNNITDYLGKILKNKYGSQHVIIDLSVHENRTNALLMRLSDASFIVAMGINFNNMEWDTGYYYKNIDSATSAWSEYR